jgi:Raf kinase inhibitor-like YbhB/YbcL family protein
VAVRPRLVSLVLGFGLAVAPACSSSDGRTLPPPDPRPTTTSSSTPAIEPGTDEGSTGPFTLRSAAFGDGGTIPEPFTCTGEATSPALSWTGTPADATTLALVARDRNAAGFVHWILTGIDPFVQGIGEGGVPENAAEGPNDAGTIGWVAPCPPSGSGTHTYEIALLALPGIVELPAGATAQQAASLLEDSAMERAVLTGTVAAGS